MPDADKPDPVEPRWQEDFPIEWERDFYVTRRELAKFLTAGSFLLASAGALVAFVGAFVRPFKKNQSGVRIASADAVAPGTSVLFRYPTDEDPCILLRSRSGELKAFSQVCTHLSCAVVQRPQTDGLFCPCHQGHFSSGDGRAIAGPPTRRLPRILLEERPDGIYSVGREA